MAVFKTNVAVDMTSFDTSDLTGATVTRTGNQVVAVGTQYTYTLDGSGFGTGSGLPNSGTVNGLTITGANGTDITFTGANVAVSTIGLTLLFGGTFTDIEGLLLGANDSLSGSKFNDHLLGYDGKDTFSMGGGGNDHVEGMSGNDMFNFAGKFDANDSVDGGADRDTLTLAGDYSDGVTLGNTSIIDVETISLTKAHSYFLTMADGNVAAGKSVIIDGTKLLATDHVTIDGTAETDGAFVFRGGAGNDTFIGGHGKDTFTGGAGADVMTGNGGVDAFVYKGVAESTGTTHDTVVGFNFLVDKFNLDVSVTGTDAAVSGNLRTAAFNADLASAVTAAKLGAHHALVFTATTGTESGHQFLVVDANGTAGYQANADYVIQLSGAGHTDMLSTSDFT